MPHINYAGPEWQRVRKVVLARDRYACQIKLDNCRGRATEVDHIVAVSQGGARLDPSNLQAACKSCNIAKRNREVAARARGDQAPESWAIYPSSGWLEDGRTGR